MMAGRPSEALALQDDELVALEAIFPQTDQVSIQRGGGGDAQHTVTFNLPVSLPKRISIDVAQDSAAAAGSAGSAGSSSSSSAVELSLAHLPPLTLAVSLPPGYPLEEPPTLQRLAAPWLSRGSAAGDGDDHADWIASRLAEMWDDIRGEVLWTWGEWLREGWAEEALAGNGPFASQGGKGRLAFVDVASLPATSTAPPTRSLADVLSAYDRLASAAAFEGGRFMCSICLDAKRGGACIKLSACSHVFCKECFLDYLTLHLTEGSLHLATSCPDPACVSSTARRGDNSSTTATASGSISVTELETILASSPDLITRLHYLVTKHAAESDPSAIPCPRTDCQTLTPLRPEDRDSSRYQSFRQCPRCSLTFCAWCRHTWHSPNPCRLSSSDALLSAYDAASPPERLQMEVRYGRKNLLRLKARFEEDKANRKWLSEHATPCPHCSSPVEKSFGCNHMSCAKCQAHFCYLCGTRLNAQQPYTHFNTPGGGCFNRLFDGLVPASDGDAGEQGGEDGDGEDDDVGVEERERREARRREQEDHLLALAAIQAAWEDEL